MQIQELQGKSDDQLNDMIAQLKKEQFNLRFQAASGEMVSQNRNREIRKDIARILTFKNAKKG